MRHTVIVLSLLLCLETYGLAFDTVEYHDAEGKPVPRVNGKIEQETPTEIVIDGKRIPVNRVVSVKYDGQPPELGLVISKLEQGRYTEVLEDLETKIIPPNDDSFLKQAMVSLQFQALANLAISDPSQAEKAVEFLKANENFLINTRHHYQVFELFGQIYLSQGDYQKATNSFGKLTEVDWPGYKEKARVFQGLTSLAQGRPAAAIGLFDEVIANRGEAAEIVKQRFAALVYKGQALVESNKLQGAEKLLRDALEEIPAEKFGEIKAIGRNALGDALRLQDKPKEALVDGYMWVKVMYNKAPRQLARALYEASVIFRTLGFRDKSKRLSAELREMFPNSQWTKKLDSQ